MPPRPERTVTVVRHAVPEPTASPSSATPEQRMMAAIKGPPLTQPTARATPALAPNTNKNNRFRSWKRRNPESSSPPSSLQHRSTTMLRASTKFYGLVPGERRLTSTATGFETLVRGTQTVGSDFSQLSAIAPSPTPFPHDDSRPLPDPPFWAVYLGAMAITAGVLFAVLLYFVNFPPNTRRRRAGGNREHQYSAVGQHDLSQQEGRVGFGITTSAHTPRETPLLVRRRKEAMSVDTTKKYEGLGIAVPGSNPPSVENVASPGSSLPDGFPGVRCLVHPATAEEEDAAYELQRRDPDLEDGLLSPRTRYRLSPDASSTGSSSSSRSSSKVRLLERVGDGIEYAADKFAKMLHDQVRGNDPEDGLVLPVKDSEREGNPYLKKLY